MVHAGCAFVASIHLSRTWMSGSFESMRWSSCVHRLDLGLYSIPKRVIGNGVRTHVNSKGKIGSVGWLRAVSNLQCCIMQDNECNTLPTKLFRPPAHHQRTHSYRMKTSTRYKHRWTNTEGEGRRRKQTPMIFFCLNFYYKKSTLLPYGITLLLSSNTYSIHGTQNTKHIYCVVMLVSQSLIHKHETQAASIAADSHTSVSLK